MQLFLYIPTNLPMLLPYRVSKSPTLFIATAITQSKVALSHAWTMAVASWLVSLPPLQFLCTHSPTTTDFV